MRVTTIYNKANDVTYLRELSGKLQIESDDRLNELEDILGKLQ